MTQNRLKKGEHRDSFPKNLCVEGGKVLNYPVQKPVNKRSGFTLSEHSGTPEQN